jgi:hypothetical protein
MELTRYVGCVYRLRIWRLERYPEEIEGALLKDRRSGDDIECRDGGILRLHAVGDDGGLSGRTMPRSLASRVWPAQMHHQLPSENDGRQQRRNGPSQVA